MLSNRKEGVNDRCGGNGWGMAVVYYCWILNKFITMSMIDKESLRMTHLAEADSIKDKQRHGFFSVPITTAIGDDGEYKTRIRMPLIMQIQEMPWENLRPPPETSRHRLRGVARWRNLT
jgi:hypothetical protein